MPDPDNITYIDATEFAEAYEAFARGQQGIINQLYQQFRAFNQQYWSGQLPLAIIRIPSHGMTRRKLGRYTRRNEQGEEHVIEINKDFVVLNPWERVLETLRHEMIHLYLIGVVNEHGCKGHGKKFKAEADRVGVPCHGPRGYGNPAKMPAPRTSYAEWKCACGVTSVRCSETRDVHAVCDCCWSPLKEDGYTPGDYTAPREAPINGGESLLAFLTKARATAADATSRLSAVEAERDSYRTQAQELFAELVEVSMLALFAHDDPLVAARRRAEATADAAIARGHDPGLACRFAGIFAELDVEDAIKAGDPADAGMEGRSIDLEPEVTVNGKPLCFDDEQIAAPRTALDLETSTEKRATTDSPASTRAPLDLD